MAQQFLTSVRFDRETLRRLRLIADVNETNIAAEVREAVRRYLDDQLASEDISQRLSEAQARTRATLHDVLKERDHQEI